MYLGLVVLGLIVVGYARWPRGDRLAARVREDSPAAERHRMVGRRRVYPQPK
jgi:hypothetical protein